MHYLLLDISLYTPHDDARLSNINIYNKITIDNTTSNNNQKRLKKKDSKAYNLLAIFILN